MKNSFNSLSLLSLALLTHCSGLQAEETVNPGALDKIVLDEIVIFGAGETRQTQTLTKEDLQQLAPGTSPIKALNKLAGVNFQAADPYGAYEWGVRISVRGFNQGQMGFTLDDVPLGDMFYSSLNGLYISRALIDENLGSAQISQGTGSLDTASSSNLGGTIKFLSINPADKMQASAAQTLGSDATRRTFVKFDSGLLSSQGKFYIAAAHQSQDLWKGEGEQGYDQVNLKFEQPIKDSTLSLFFDYSDRYEMDHQDMTKEWINKLGYNWSNYWPNLQAAIANASATSGCCGVPALGNASVNDPLDAAYYSASGVRRDYLGYASLDTALTDNLEWKTTFYGHGYQGVSTWATPYKATPGENGAPISERVLAYDTRRLGVLNALDWAVGQHTINTGIWYENNLATQKRLFFPIYLNGPLWSPYDIPDESTAFLTQWAYEFNTNTVQYHLQDTWQLNDFLTLHGGFKSLFSTTSGTPTVNNLGRELAQGSMSVADGFLPQFGAILKVSPNDEIFADVSNTTRSFQQGGYGLGISPWAVGNQAAFQLIQRKIRPETAWTYEAGYRFRRVLDGDILRSFEGSLTGYHVDFSNRLLNISPGGSLIEATAGAALLANVGGVTTNGVELGNTFHLFNRLSWYNALSYNSSTYDANYSDADKIIETAGKTVVDSPRILYKTDLTYQAEHYFLRLNADYMTTRYFTYTNDQSVSPRWIFNFSVGNSFGKVGLLSDVSLNFNIYNIFDEKYISTMGTGGFTASGDNQTLQVGAPRQLFITLKVSL